MVRIHSPRPPSNKIGGTEYHAYEFWVGSWVRNWWRWLATLVNPDELEPGIDFALFDRLVDTQAATSVLWRGLEGKTGGKSPAFRVETSNFWTLQDRVPSALNRCESASLTNSSCGTLETDSLCRLQRWNACPIQLCRSG